MDDNSDGTIDFYEADLLSATDYYPFGMSMPGRNFNNGNEYKFGLNGQEKSTEINNNSTTAEFGSMMQGWEGAGIFTRKALRVFLKMLLF